MFVQTCQILHEFCCYLARLNGNRGSLNWLHKRLAAESDVLLQPVSGFKALAGSSYEEAYSFTEHMEEVSIDGEES